MKPLAKGLIFLFCFAASASVGFHGTTTRLDLCPEAAAAVPRDSPQVCAALTRCCNKTRSTYCCEHAAKHCA